MLDVVFKAWYYFEVYGGGEGEGVSGKELCISYCRRVDIYPDATYRPYATPSNPIVINIQCTFPIPARPRNPGPGVDV